MNHQWISVLGFGLAAMCFSCSTVMTPDGGSSYAPKGSQKQGTVAYNPDGFTEIVQIRRNDALKSIYAMCGNSNEYEILKEETRDKKSEEGGTVATMGASRLRLITYQCKK